MSEEEAIKSVESVTEERDLTLPDTHELARAAMMAWALDRVYGAFA